MAVKIEKVQLPHGTFYTANGLPISEEIISFALKHSDSVEAFFEEFNNSNETTIYGFIANKEMDLNISKRKRKEKMQLLKDMYYQIYEKICNRCVKCPFYYYERGWEDNSEGCELKGWNWDESLCINMLLPKWLLKIKYKLYELKADRKYVKYEKKMMQKAKKCPKKCEECYWEDCDYIR